MQHLVAEAGLADVISVDSAGTGDWHVGDPPHEGTRAELARNQIQDAHMRARQVSSGDLETFDYVLAMDTINLADLRAIAARDELDCELSLLLAHATDPAVRAVVDVPDPYYVGGFDRVFELVNAACIDLLAEIIDEHRLGAAR